MKRVVTILTLNSLLSVACGGLPFINKDDNSSDNHSQTVNSDQAKIEAEIIVTDNNQDGMDSSDQRSVYGAVA